MHYEHRQAGEHELETSRIALMPQSRRGSGEPAASVKRIVNRQLQHRHELEQVLALMLALAQVLVLAQVPQVVP